MQYIGLFTITGAGYKYPAGGVLKGHCYGFIGFKQAIGFYLDIGGKADKGRSCYTVVAAAWYWYNKSTCGRGSGIICTPYGGTTGNINFYCGSNGDGAL